MLWLMSISEYTTMVQYILLILVLVQYSWSQILPGTVPSLPNPTLEGCQKDALSANNTSNYTSTYAQVIDSWCGYVLFW